MTARDEAAIRDALGRGGAHPLHGQPCPTLRTNGHVTALLERGEETAHPFAPERLGLLRAR